MSRVSGNSGPLAATFAALRDGSLSRRQFVERATALGVGIGAALALANTVSAQTPTDDAAASSRPTSGTDGQERGAGGDLKILQWQAPTHLSPHNGTGVKDIAAAGIVLEPLVHYLPDATQVPNLVTELPTVENGLLAEDFTSVTYTLLPGVTWSDGEPFTADDVVFTWQWIMDSTSASVNTLIYESIANIEAVDELTAKITFTNPNPFWSVPFAGATSGFVYPKHILEGGGAEANDAFKLNPIGTGPFKVESFSANDQVVFTLNELYRETNKPYFARVVLKGGGDPASAARAVLQSGEYDYAWNLSVEPEILEGMVSESSPGVYAGAPGVTIERIDFNFSDPNQEVDGQRSEKNTPHPFLSDPVVRQAFSLAIDRDKIANSFYLGGDTEPAIGNFVSGIPAIESPNTTWAFDPDQANQLLDEAGWTKDGDTRKKDGVELKVQYATTVNQLRQKIQAVVKSNLEDIGFKVELVQVDSGSYFDSSPGNDQNISHFYWDLEMYASLLTSPLPISYLRIWYAGENGENIAQASNQWSARNLSRYQNPDFDAVYDGVQTETDAEKVIAAFIEMNDILINDHATVPLVRWGLRAGFSRTLNQENLGLAGFSYDYWNIANWNRVQ